MHSILPLHTYLTFFIVTLQLRLYDHLLQSHLFSLELALLLWGPKPLVMQLLIY